MKEDDRLLDIHELITSVENLKSVRKADLRRFYLQRHPNLTEQTFRRLIYSLEKQRVITSIGAGVYVLQEASLSFGKSKFTFALSNEAEEVNSAVQKSFPYIHYLIWDTKILHEFMIHQPGQSQIILEIEKDVCESVFNRLKEQFMGKIFLDPDRISFERYILNNPESIIISRLITQSPKIISNGVPTARLEKILVDIFADENRFFVFHGQELISIYENAFTAYWINEKTLFRYAGRRKVAKRLRTFITTQTQIGLIQSPGLNELLRENIA
jgi:hypothetical protein